MKAVVQRVTQASVDIDGARYSEIGKGMLVLLGVEKGDTEEQADYMSRRVGEFRIFEDPQGKMNLSVEDIGGELLVVSQFTICADCRKGRRPGFDNAAPPDVANALYERFVAKLRERGIGVKTGQFAAEMAVSLVNDGPVTFILERPPGTPGR